MKLKWSLRNFTDAITRVGWALWNISFTDNDGSNTLEYDLPNYIYYGFVFTWAWNTTGATCWAGFAHPSGAPELTPSLWWRSCCSVFKVFYVVCCVLFVFWSFPLNAMLFSFLCCVFCTVYLCDLSPFLSMAFSVYFQLLSLHIPLRSYA